MFSFLCSAHVQDKNKNKKPHDSDEEDGDGTDDEATTRLDIAAILAHLDDDDDDDVNSDDDEATTAKKKAKRVLDLMEWIEEKDGCTFEKAHSTVMNSKEILNKIGVTTSSIKKLDYKTAKGRQKAKDKMFRRIVDSCPFQSQLMSKLRFMSGRHSKEKILDNCWKFEWDEGLLDLYILFMCEMDHIRIKEKNKKKDEIVMLRKMNKYYEMEHELMKNFNWDKILKNEEADLRAQTMNAVEYRMDPKKDGKYFYECYDNIRMMLRVKNVMIYESYIAEYGTNEDNNNNKNKNKNKNLSAQERVANICHAFNFSINGCPLGNNCKLDHICFLDFKSNHGACNCFIARDYFLKIGQLGDGKVGAKRTRFQRDYNGGYSRGRGRGRGRGGYYNNNNNNNSDNGTYRGTGGGTQYIQGPPGTNTVMINGKWYDKRKDTTT